MIFRSPQQVSIRSKRKRDFIQLQIEVRKPVLVNEPFVQNTNLKSNDQHNYSRNEIMQSKKVLTPTEFQTYSYYRQLPFFLPQCRMSSRMIRNQN